MSLLAGFAQSQYLVNALAPLLVQESKLSADFGLYLPYLGSTGVSAASLTPVLNLPRNTVVQRLQLVVGATRATRTPARQRGRCGPTTLPVSTLR